MKLTDKQLKKISNKKIENMPYVEFMAFLNEVNRPPGGKDSVRQLIQNCFINNDTKVLDIGCNTGYCTFEISRISKCEVDGIDISKAMIGAAKRQQSANRGSGKVNFYVGDATKLPFGDSKYDVVVSGGSIAFIDDREKAFKEIMRVLKNWGFFGDINFYYKTPPPKPLIRRVSDLIEAKILPWDRKYWIDQYIKAGFEIYYVFDGKIKQVSKRDVENYCQTFSDEQSLSKAQKKIVFKKLTNYMQIFNNNHRYLSFGIFILRKRPNKEQISLFGA